MYVTASKNGKGGALHLFFLSHVARCVLITGEVSPRITCVPVCIFTIQRPVVVVAERATTATGRRWLRIDSDVFRCWCELDVTCGVRRFSGERRDV